MNLKGNPQNLAAYNKRYKQEQLAANLREIEATGAVKLTHLVGSCKSNAHSTYFPNGTIIHNEDADDE